MKKILLLISIVMLSACSTTIGNKELKTSKSGISSQMKELKTKNELKAKFGSPYLIFSKDSNEVYEYRKINGSGRYHWLVPIAGWIVSAFQDDYTFRETNLFVYFDKKDNIKDYKVVRTTGTSN